MNFKNSIRNAFIFIVLSFFSLNIQAKVKLPSILADNMVLQQKTSVKLWGWANENSKIKVITSWDKKLYVTTSDNKGNWLLKVNTPAAGGPYEISFNDGEKTSIKDILIGEVWFCSGQSNMEMPMQGFDRQPLKGATDFIVKANPKVPIRMFTADVINGKRINQFNKQVQNECKGQWLDNRPENVSVISAVGYYYARYIQEVLNVPVGIVVSTLGGSKVEAWMSREALEPFKKDVDLSILDNDVEIKKATNTPCVLYNSKIAPLMNFTIKGFLWYQGESNHTNPDLYARLMPAFVSNLRTKWNIGEFPFYFVQIAPFKYANADSTLAARLREVQTQHMADIPNSGMVPTLDIGNLNFIHPVDKETVGKRLAWWALGATYGIKGFDYATPVYKSMEIKGNKIYVNFKNADRGISPMWTDLKGFEMAGTDKVFYPAKAEIETSTTRLAVSCDKVPDPVAVRYAYKNYAEASIFGLSGIPVPSFRTDNW